MSRGTARASFLSFVLAVIATLVVGGALIVTREVDLPGSTAPPQRPTITPTAGYEILVRRGVGTDERLSIDREGRGCDGLAPSRLLDRACTLATALDPSVIAGEAFGGLNLAYTAVSEAIFWRARLSEGPSFCGSAGLTDALLSRCIDAVASEEYTVQDAGVVVTIPRG